MISTNQKRKHIRVGTNLVAKVSNENRNERIVYIKNVSATGAKIISRDEIAQVGDIMTLQFKYKNVLYDLLCKIVRAEYDPYQYGVQFYFKGENEPNSTNININNNKNKLYSDILNEYFSYKDFNYK